MGRARTIKPGFFTNEHLCALEPLARLLFAGLWTIADRDGRLQDRPARIGAQLLPYDREADVDALLWDLHRATFIVRYRGQDGVRYLWIPTFLDHQKPHPKEPAGVIPPPEESVVLESPEILTAFNQSREKVRSSREKVCKDLPGITGKVKEGPESKKKEKKLLEAKIVRSDFVNQAPQEEGLAPASCDHAGQGALFPQTAESQPRLSMPDVLVETIRAVALRIQRRHPKVRSCSPGQAERLLAVIAKRFKPQEQIAAIRAIDEIHEGWCASDDWTKDDGQYAKGLENWLAPTKERYMNRAPPGKKQNDPSSLLSDLQLWRPPKLTEEERQT